MKRMICAAAALFLLQIPADAAAIPQYPPIFAASFLQGWYCRDWSKEQWQTEFTDMKAAGLNAVILQSTVDLNYAYDNSGAKTDPNAYSLKDSYALYPSSLTAGTDSDALECALQAAAEHDMQVYIGTVNDNRWWNYGWGIPDSGFTEWSSENAAQCAAVIREIMQQYGERYSAQIAGFYYNNEIWNMDKACDGTDGGAYAAVIGGNIAQNLAALRDCAPALPLMISPFYNTDLSAPDAYGKFWSALIENSGLRKQDILACQDGGGRDYDTAAIGTWNEALYAAANGQMHVWCNHETFNTDGSTKPLADLHENYDAVPYAEKHILFSWNHYIHGKYDAEFAKLMQQFTGDINADGACTATDVQYLVYWLRHDRIALRNPAAGDLNADGVLNAADLTLLKRHLLTKT